MRMNKTTLLLSSALLVSSAPLWAKIEAQAGGPSVDQTNQVPVININRRYGRCVTITFTRSSMSALRVLF